MKTPKRKKTTARRHQRPQQPQPAFHCEADVVEGLEAIALAEIETQFGKRAQIDSRQAVREPGRLAFTYHGPLNALLRLQTAAGIFIVLNFDIPRPRALLGQAYFNRLLEVIAAVRALWPRECFHTLYLSAAGSESATLLRLQDTLAEITGLTVDSEQGDLLLRMRRPPDNRPGWEVLVRLSPRPLATRPWRVCNMEGALNATVAHAMALLTDPRPYDTFLNLACGSGTLLIERAECAPARRLIGCDNDPAALECAKQNVAASGHASIEHYDWDARQLPLPAQSIDALAADLPFGHLVGSHEENLALYPAILQEAARVAKPGAPFALISHEIRLVEELAASSQHWALAHQLRINLGGLHPGIYLLQRTTR